MVSGNFVFKLGENISIPNKQKQSVSLDSSKGGTIPPLEHCLVTTVPGCDSGQPESRSLSQQYHSHAHVP